MSNPKQLIKVGLFLLNNRINTAGSCFFSGSNFSVTPLLLTSPAGISLCTFSKASLVQTILLPAEH